MLTITKIFVPLNTIVLQFTTHIRLLHTSILKKFD